MNPAELIADVQDTLVERDVMIDLDDRNPLAYLYAAIAKGERVVWKILPRDENGERIEGQGSDDFVVYNTFLECFQENHRVWEHIEVVDLNGGG